MSNQLSVKIEDIGLKNYLEKTRAQHNDQGYDQFVFYLNSDKKLGKSAIGRLMNVHRKTIDKWMEIHSKETSNANR